MSGVARIERQTDFGLTSDRSRVVGIMALLLFAFSALGSLAQSQTSEDILTPSFGGIPSDAQAQGSADSLRSFTRLTQSARNEGTASRNPNGLRPKSEGFPTDNFLELKPNAPYQLTARFHLERGTTKGYLILSVQLAPGAYIHSLTQKKEMNPSVVTVPVSDDYRIVGEFHADRPPTVIEKDPIFEQRLEKHVGQVQFFVPLELRDGLDVAQIKLQLVFNGQVCTDEGICLPLRNQIVPAQFAGFFERAAGFGSRSPK